ncbi:MAG: pyridoxal phosphate-dependent aminotransferase [Fimbriimonadaceae bacterium]|nr:pyridoxal phosphate-dependent aminotransferase [Fimbriimonadaceae bacterium]
MARLQPSPTLAITALAKTIDGCLSFAAGEPDFNTPDEICDAAIQAMQSGQTKYTPSSGLPKLKEAIAAKLKRDNGIPAEPGEIVVSCGAKHSVSNVMQALLDPGDEVILFAPYWMTYKEQVLLAEGVPVVVQTQAKNGFVPAVDQMRGAITGRTRAMILNSPGNPTGAGWSRQAIKEAVALALRHGFWIISDEIYEKLVYDGFEPVSPASLGAEARAQTITINGCSKSYAMTGWRIGYAHAPKAVAAGISNLQDQVTSNPTSFAQIGAIAAMEMAPEKVEEMRQTFAARRSLMLDLLGEIDGIKVHAPQGAFYAFPDVSAWLGGEVDDDEALAKRLLTDAKIACIPGSVFEAPGHLRLSYACGEAQIREGIGRLREGLARIKT